MSVVVLGSANLDLVCEVDRIPRPGETLLASGFAQHPGGKGNNQVTAAARAGASASFIAAVGNDGAADILLQSLRQSQVTCLVRRSTAPTGTALITVDKAAENTVVVYAGANAELLGLGDDELAAISAANVLLLQLEIPLATAIDGARAARAAGTRVVLNAAPIRALPHELLENVDLLVVNEHEARLLIAGPEADVTDAAAATVEDAELLAQELLRLVPAAVVTLGRQGAVVRTSETGAVHVPGHRVTAVDTTGAGDTFCGALAAALDANADESFDGRIVAAAEFATAAAALSVQRAGAVPSIPTRKEIDHFRSLNTV